PGRRLGPATQTRPKSRLRSCRRRSVVTHVGLLRHRRGTNRPAIDTGRSDGDEKLAVETRITTDARTVQHGAIQTDQFTHAEDDTPPEPQRLAAFGPEPYSASKPASRARVERLPFPTCFQDVREQDVRARASRDGFTAFLKTGRGRKGARLTT